MATSRLNSGESPRGADRIRLGARVNTGRTSDIPGALRSEATSRQDVVVVVLQGIAIQKHASSLGLGLMANAALALQFSDQIESALGLNPTKQEEERLQQTIPKISLIDRDDVK